jgi:hypothetical protein
MRAWLLAFVYFVIFNLCFGFWATFEKADGSRLLKASEAISLSVIWPITMPMIGSAWLWISVR